MDKSYLTTKIREKAEKRFLKEFDELKRLLKNNKVAQNLRFSLNGSEINLSDLLENQETIDYENAKTTLTDSYEVVVTDEVMKKLSEIEAYFNQTEPTL